MPNQQHHLIRIQTQTLSLIQLRTQRLRLQSSSPFPDRPWHGENCFADTSESSMKNPHTSCDTSSSCHHQNLSSYLFSNWNHVSWTHDFWKICGTWLRSLGANALLCIQLPTEGIQQ